MLRQGDVLLVPVEGRSTKNLKYVKRKRGEGIILAAGEATGHHHRVRSTSAREYRKGKERFLFVGPKGAAITHEEHDPVDVSQGVFKIVQQREYEPVIKDDSVVQRATRNVYD